jgi:hypothetical protein
MRRFSKIPQGRTGLVLGGALVTMLVLPVTAFAGGFSAPNGTHHAAATGSGGSGGLAILLGIVAVLILSAVVLGRVGEQRESRTRAAKHVRRQAGRHRVVSDAHRPAG